VANEVVPGVVDSLDVDELLERVDVNVLLERIDLDLLVEHLDINRIVERIDLEALLASVDLNAVLARVDIDALLERTELGAVISRSGGAIASRTLDVVRSQGVGLDAFVERWSNRILRRRNIDAANGPPLLLAGDDLATAHDD
jgi:hypothetical protein